jgi:hypothetical protein
MPAPRNVHRQATRLMSAILVGLGVAMLVSTVVAGGGPLAYGVLMGVLFIVAGAARFWLTVRGPQG